MSRAGRAVCRLLTSPGRCPSPASGAQRSPVVRPRSQAAVDTEPRSGWGISSGSCRQTVLSGSNKPDPTALLPEVPNPGHCRERGWRLGASRPSTGSTVTKDGFRFEGEAAQAPTTPS